MPENILQLIKFALVGGVNTFIDWAVYLLIIKIFSPESIIYYTAAKGFSYFCGMINSFFLNRYWTFNVQSSDNEKNRFLKFVLVNAVSLGINTGSLYLLLRLNGHHLVALFLATAASFVFNFSLNKMWVFRGRKAAPEATGR
ncbi:MAG: GtrA family protein [Peptococcaceae bacterium]|nr:MAG: GtrA family protein [Peptococcaceae bacterium]